MRLIDANALSRAVCGIGKDIKRPRAVELMCLVLISEAITVDAMEVVHGHWISKGYKIECSVCEHRAFLGTHDPVIHTEEKNIRKYCHNCGAKMDGEL